MSGWAPPGWLQKWGADNGLAAVAVEPDAKATATAEAGKPAPRKTAWADDEPIGPRVERDEPPAETVDLPPAGWTGRSWTNQAAIRRGENIDGILHGAYPDGSLAEALAEAAAHNRLVYTRETTAKPTSNRRANKSKGSLVMNMRHKSGCEPDVGVRTFAARMGLRLSEKQLGSIGQEAAARHRRAGVEPKRGHDGKWTANLYRISILMEMLPDIKAIEAAGLDATRGELPSGLFWSSHRPWREV